MGDSAIYECGSQAVLHISPPPTHREDEISSQAAAYRRELDEVLTDNETMVWYMHDQEPNTERRDHKLPTTVPCGLWTGQKSFSTEKILNKAGSFKRGALMPESRVVVADIKSFLDI